MTYPSNPHVEGLKCPNCGHTLVPDGHTRREVFYYCDRCKQTFEETEVG